MAKSDNLLAILWMLRSRKRMTAREIAEELEVDVRTVYRYIDALCYSGAPVIAEPGPAGGYGLLESFQNAPLFFSTAERIALAHAGVFARQAGYPHSRALRDALAKIERQLSPEQLADLHLHTSGLEVINSEANTDLFSIGEDGEESDPIQKSRRQSPGMQETLTVIEEAVAAGRTLSILHRRERSAPPLRRKVDPYGLIYWHENWYLVGYCHLRKDVRTFRCDRIESLDRTERQFERPKDFSARRHFLQYMIPKEALKTAVTIRVRGTPYAIESLSRHWFLGNFVREQEGETLGLAVDVDQAAQYLPYLVLSYASEMTILEPQRLRDLVARLAREIAKAHEGPVPRDAPT